MQKTPKSQNLSFFVFLVFLSFSFFFLFLFLFSAGGLLFCHCSHVFWMLQHPIWPFENQHKCCISLYLAVLVVTAVTLTYLTSPSMWTQCGWCHCHRASAASSSSPSSAPSAPSGAVSGAVSGAASAVSASRASCIVHFKSLTSFITCNLHIISFTCHNIYHPNPYCRYLKWCSFYLRMFKNFTCVQMPLLLSLRLHHPLSFS